MLCFTGGVGWESEPKTDGFGLKLNGQAVRFDVTREPQRWASKDGSLELIYLPTWKSDVDSGGFFFLALAKPMPALEGDRISISVQSLGEGSHRWFAVDLKQETERTLGILSAALESPSL